MAAGAQGAPAAGGHAVAVEDKRRAPGRSNREHAFALLRSAGMLHRERVVPCVFVIREIYLHTVRHFLCRAARCNDTKSWITCFVAKRIDAMKRVRHDQIRWRPELLELCH